jgi:hypothetical protein
MRSAPVFLLLVLLPSTAAAQAYTREVTPFIGYQTGGAVIIDDRSSGLEDGPAFGVTFTFDRGPGRKLDLVYGHETTNAVRNDPFGAGPATLKYQTYVDYLQIGGRYVWTPEQRVAPYIALTAGGTRLAVNEKSAILFSYAFGGGADVRLSERTAIRFDGRFTNTLSGDRSTYECQSGGSCRGFSTGSMLTQFTASTGIVIRY